MAKEPSRYAIDGILLESTRRARAWLPRTAWPIGHGLNCGNAGELGDQALMPHRFCRLIDKLTARDTDFLALALHRKKAKNGDTLPGRILLRPVPDWVLSTYECDGRFPIYRDIVPRSHSKFASIVHNCLRP